WDLLRSSVLECGISPAHDVLDDRLYCSGPIHRGISSPALRAIAWNVTWLRRACSRKRSAEAWPSPRMARQLTLGDAVGAAVLMVSILMVLNTSAMCCCVRRWARMPEIGVVWARYPALVLWCLTLLLLSPVGSVRAAAQDVSFPARVQQGAMVIGKVAPKSKVIYDGRTLAVTDYGTVVFGVAPDATGPLHLHVTPPGGAALSVDLAVQPRDWPVERVDRLPPKTVSPPPQIAARIRREQARVAEARANSDSGRGFAEAFIWPVHGRVSGRFGSRRVYNGIPGAPHSGMDIAVPTGTPVKAPASGRV